MFSDDTTACYEFESNWQAVSTTRENGVQCEEFVQNNVGTQVVCHQENCVQTDEVDGRAEVKFGEYDTKCVAEFLRKVTPGVLDLLERNLKCRAFDDLDLDFEEEVAAVTKIHALNYKGFSSEHNFRCKDLTWNAIGSSIAVSYGCNEHDGWCIHSPGICVWNLNRKDCNESKPNQVIETSSCVISLEFHPQSNNILAGGSINGNVVLWNLNKSNEENPAVWTTKTDDEGHSDAVTCVTWIKSTDRVGSKYLLLSAGLDGRVLIWSQHERTSELKLVKGFAMVSDQVSRNAGFRLGGKKMGVTSLSFNAEDPNVFVVCTEGGGVFQCSLDSQRPTGESLLDVPLFSPILTSFKPHKGHVNAISFSPFTRNAFTTCGSDGELRIYSLLQPGPPIITIHNETPITCVCWSNCRPLVVAFGTRDGKMCFCDLNKNCASPVFGSSCAEVGEQVGKLVFGRKEARWLATCAEDGNINVWKLGKEFTALRSHEKETLIRLLRGS